MTLERPDKTRGAWQTMEDEWVLLRDLRSGTQGMRDQWEKRLPRHPAEKQNFYKFRLRSTYLYPAYDDTVDKLSSKPFKKPVMVTEELLPDNLAGILENADKSGRTLNTLAAEWFEDGVDRGLSHVIVDMPQFPMDEAGEIIRPTIEQERDFDLRPRFVHVPADQLRWWVYANDAMGQKQLVEIRIHECESRVVDGTERDVTTVRVYRQNEVIVFENVGHLGAWVETARGPNELGKIPLVTFYTNRTGDLVAEPPLRDLGWLNLRHYQGSSQQNVAVDYARNPIIHMSGVSAEEKEKGIIVGPGAVAMSLDPSASMGYVEHSGDAIKAGKEDLRALEERMEVLGLQPLVERRGSETATGKRIDSEASQSIAQGWARDMQEALKQCFALAFEWTSQEMPDEFDVDVFDDFAIGQESVEKIKLVQADATRGAITNEMYLVQSKKYGLYGDEMDPVAEAEAAEAEADKRAEAMLQTMGETEPEPEPEPVDEQ